MTNSEVDGVSVVTLDGRIVLGEESTSFREKLKSMIAEGKKKIVLNMANIKYIDSADWALWSRRISAPKIMVHLCASPIWVTNSTKFLQITKLLTVSMFTIPKQPAVSSFPKLVGRQQLAPGAPSSVPEGGVFDLDFTASIFNDLRFPFEC